MSMIAKTNLISCNFSTIPSLALTTQKLKIPLQTHKRIFPYRVTSVSSTFFKPLDVKTSVSSIQKISFLHICRNSSTPQNFEDPDLRKENALGGNGNGNGNGGEGREWTTSILLFLLWGALMYYVFFLAPNQTPVNSNYVFHLQLRKLFV